LDSDGIYYLLKYSDRNGNVGEVKNILIKHGVNGVDENLNTGRKEKIKLVLREFKYKHII
jgi:hypothetical protein